MLKDDALPPTDTPGSDLPAFAASVTPALVQVLRGDHLGVMIRDLDEALAWYRAALGAVIIDRWDDAASGMARAHIDIGRMRLEFVQMSSLAASEGNSVGPHHIALEVADCADATKALVAAGGSVVMGPEYFDRHGMDWSFVADPFGSILEMVSYRAPRE